MNVDLYGGVYQWLLDFCEDHVFGGLACNTWRAFEVFGTLGGTYRGRLVSYPYRNGVRGTLLLHLRNYFFCIFRVGPERNQRKRSGV